ncbi:MAG: hypothetical protein EOM05_05820 [Clostridia bacterium]|nr:hypothetical protein [Clostridia bacterium]
MKPPKSLSELNKKKSAFYDRFSVRISFAIRAIEIFLSCMLILSVVIASIYMIIDFISDSSLIDQLINYDNFQQLLSYLLLLIIALELAIMLIRHNPNNVIEVMIYAIARKTLIYNSSATEMLIGVLTLSILFAVRIYLVKCPPDNLELNATTSEPEKK